MMDTNQVISNVDGGFYHTVALETDEDGFDGTRKICLRVGVPLTNYLGRSCDSLESWMDTKCAEFSE